MPPVSIEEFPASISGAVTVTRSGRLIYEPEPHPGECQIIFSPSEYPLNNDYRLWITPNTEVTDLGSDILATLRMEETAFIVTKDSLMAIKMKTESEVETKEISIEELDTNEMYLNEPIQIGLNYYQDRGYSFPYIVTGLVDAEQKIIGIDLGDIFGPATD